MHEFSPCKVRSGENTIFHVFYQAVSVTIYSNQFAAASDLIKDGPCCLLLYAKMAPYLSAHWVTPCVMVFSILIGIAFALGHHFFYASLENKPTATSDYTLYGTHYPGQQVNIAVGTAFAFLARSAFVLAISTAFYQVFWKKMKHDSRHKKPPSLQKVDVVYSGPTNLVSLFNFSVWLQYPLLFLMVLSMW